MTVEEYASACEAVGDTLEESGNLDEGFTSGFDAMEDALEEIGRWNPPEELQEFHGVRLRSMEAAIDALEETGALDLIREFEEAAEEEDTDKALELLDQMAELEDEMARFDDQMSALEDDVERALEDLSSETRQILADANCL